MSAELEHVLAGRVIPAAPSAYLLAHAAALRLVSHGVRAALDAELRARHAAAAAIGAAWRRSVARRVRRGVVHACWAAAEVARAVNAGGDGAAGGGAARAARAARLGAVAAALGVGGGGGGGASAGWELVEVTPGWRDFQLQLRFRVCGRSVEAVLANEWEGGATGEGAEYAAMSLQLGGEVWLIEPGHFECPYDFCDSCSFVGACVGAALSRLPVYACETMM
jgi:hypothetical protein